MNLIPSRIQAGRARRAWRMPPLLPRRRRPAAADDACIGMEAAWVSHGDPHRDALAGAVEHGVRPALAVLLPLFGALLMVLAALGVMAVFDGWPLPFLPG